MSNVKITDLSAGTALGGSELFEAVQTSSSVKISAQQIKNYAVVDDQAYASFYSTADQTAAAANTTYIATFNNSASYNTGITIASSTNITVTSAGVYQGLFNAQLANSDTTDRTATFWLRKNGVNISDSATIIAIPKAADGGVAFFQFAFIEQMTASQYLQVAWQVSNTGVRLDYVAAAGDVPNIPSIIFTLNRIA